MTKIGIANYLNIISNAVDYILPVSNTNRQVALYSFGGSTINEHLALSNHTYSLVSSTITDPESTIDWNNNYGNVVADAIDNAISLLSSMNNTQKYHIIFVAGNPLQNGFGNMTNPNNFDDPCDSAILSKMKGIQTYVILIGIEGINFVKQYYSCITEKESDLIIIHPISPSYDTIQNKLCKSNGYDIQITEVNPINTSYPQFIEILNRGSTANIQACWNNGSICSQAKSVQTGQYLVASVGGEINGDVQASILGVTQSVCHLCLYYERHFVRG